MHLQIVLRSIKKSALNWGLYIICMEKNCNSMYRSCSKAEEMGHPVYYPGIDTDV